MILVVTGQRDIAAPLRVDRDQLREVEVSVCS